MKGGKYLAGKKSLKDLQQKPGITLPPAAITTDYFLP